ncbi:MAG: hypothetical protein ABEK16_01250 [Candidatus Nanohalobium sp.]
MILILAGRKDIQKGPVKELYSRLSLDKASELMELEPPSEVVFGDQLDKIRKKLEPGTELIGYCFGGTYALNIEDDWIDSKIVIDPPEGVEDSNGETIAPDFSTATFLIGSGSMDEDEVPDSVESKFFDTDHWFSDSRDGLVDAVAERLEETY